MKRRLTDYFSKVNSTVTTVSVADEATGGEVNQTNESPKRQRLNESETLNKGEMMEIPNDMVSRLTLRGSVYT
jgi:hypothetical protein